MKLLESILQQNYVWKVGVIMNILLSAFACEPNMGSEPGVGWNFVRILSKNHHVTVLTEIHQKEKIEAVSELPELQNVRFVFIKGPFRNLLYKRNHHGNKVAIFLYYYMWQIIAYLTAKDLSKSNQYDVVHHVTYCVFRVPSFLYLLGKPFIWGPVGGGEKAPLALYKLKYFGLKSFIREMARSLSNVIMSRDIFVRLCAKKAGSILATTEQTKELFDKKIWDKISIFSANRLGNEILEIKNKMVDTKTVCNNSKFKVIYAGQLRGLKGVHLALMAFDKFRKIVPNSELIIVGEGETKNILVKLTKKLGLEHHVIFREWMNRESLFKVFTDCQVFLMPSLHDSSSLVVIEAMLFGLPVVCLDLGGPGMIITDKVGVKVKAVTSEQVVKDLSCALLFLYQNEETRMRMAKNAEKFALEYSNDQNVINILDNIYHNCRTQTS